MEKLSHIIKALSTSENVLKMNSFSTAATTTAIPNSSFNNINIAGKLIAGSYLRIIKLPINDFE